MAIFAIASRFNHACATGPRNVAYFLDGETGAITMVVCADSVPAGAELLISYGSSPRNLYASHGFRCQCGGCIDPLTEEEVRRLEMSEWGDR
jgi:hypothetical protein